MRTRLRPDSVFSSRYSLAWAICLRSTREAGLPLPDPPQDEGVALAGQVLDGRPGVADGDLLEGHDVRQGAQGVLAAEHALEVAESVLVQEAGR